MELLEYDAELTRALYRSIAREDQDSFTHLTRGLSKVGGIIGNAFFVDIEIREGRMFVEKHRIRECNYTDRAIYEINHDSNTAWDADGVWVPAVIVEWGEKFEAAAEAK